MALQKDFYDRITDTTIPDCYFKIANNEGIVGGKDMVFVKILGYENRDDADLNQNEIFQLDLEIVPDLGSSNLFEQAYLHAKESDFFEGAIDV